MRRLQRPQLNKMSMQRLLNGLLLLLLGASLTACGGNKQAIKTVDDSADYKSARALPPLKKPSRVLTAPATEAPEEAPVVDVKANDEPKAEAIADMSTPESELVSEQVMTAEPMKAEPIAEAEPIAQQEQEQQEQEKIAQPEIAPEEIVAADEVANASAKPTSTGLVARVLTEKGGKARLKIDAGFQEAWQYLTENLQKSDITVFSRNKVAGRFSVGCSGVAEDAEPTRKKGGWSFFARDTKEQFEYCALEAVEKRGATMVSVLNRSGIEVSSNSSAKIFERLLNN